MGWSIFLQSAPLRRDLGNLFQREDVMLLVVLEPVREVSRDHARAERVDGRHGETLSIDDCMYLVIYNESQEVLCNC